MRKCPFFFVCDIFRIVIGENQFDHTDLDYTHQQSWAKKLPDILDKNGKTKKNQPFGEKNDDDTLETAKYAVQYCELLLFVNAK